MLENSVVASNIVSHQENISTIEKRRLTYHRLKKMIREKYKWKETFPIGNGMERCAHEHNSYSINARMGHNKKRAACPKLKKKTWEQKLDRK